MGAALLTLAAAGCAPPPERVASEQAASVSAHDRAESAEPVSPGVPPPTRVAIPAIELDEPLIELGVTSDGAMEVPSDYDDVGWFSGGGRPGGIGPTVLAAHVDSATGPAVFDRLRELAGGNDILVTTSAGGEARYRVESVGDFSKNEFPTVDVFGATPSDVIRLITCSGDFDAAVGSYEQNFVVFGVRVRDVLEMRPGLR